MGDGSADKLIGRDREIEYLASFVDRAGQSRFAESCWSQSKSNLKLVALTVGVASRSTTARRDAVFNPSRGFVQASRIDNQPVASLPTRSRSRLGGVAALATGAALVVNILAGVDLRLAVGVAVGIIGAALWWLDRSAAPGARSHFRHLAGIGAASGFIATIAYDLTRTGLAFFDPSPYNPFEAISAFGTLLAGEQASTSVVIGVGLAYHFVNGVTFGAAFALLSRKGGVFRGILWGLGLEAFQLALYPGWLDIRAYQEFARISAAGHLVYGATIGALVARQLKSKEATYVH